MRRQVVRGIDRRRAGVVLVDDSVDIRWLTRRALEREGGFQVVGEAANGDAAVELTLACRPGLVLLDLTRPGSGGLAALARLREEAPQTAVILFARSVRAEDVAQALELGALGVIRKGAPLADVVLQIRTLLASRTSYAGPRAVASAG